MVDWKITKYDMDKIEEELRSICKEQGCYYVESIFSDDEVGYCKRCGAEWGEEDFIILRDDEDNN